MKRIIVYRLLPELCAALLSYLVELKLLCVRLDTRSVSQLKRVGVCVLRLAARRRRRQTTNE